MNDMRQILKYFILIFGIPALCISCINKSYKIFDKSPAERMESAEANLRKILTSSPGGWHMTYFPELDTSLNTDISANYKTGSEALVPKLLMQKIGMGGFNIFVKFYEDGTADFLSDIPLSPTDLDSYYFAEYREEPFKVGYSIKTADDLNLLFTTSSDFEELFSLTDKVSNRFIPVTISENEIILKTPKYYKKGKEEIIMRKLEVMPEQWKEKMKTLVSRKESFKYRSYNESKTEQKPGTYVLEVKITASDKVVYRTTLDFGQNFMTSRLRYKSSSDPEIHKRINTYDRKQYALFLKNEETDKTTSGYDGSRYYTGLGSGFIATDDGLIFNPGFVFDENVSFRHFKETTRGEWVSSVGQYTASIKNIIP